VAKEAPQDTLARLGARTATVFAVRIAPSSVTIRRVVQRTCPGGLADLLGCDPAGLTHWPWTARVLAARATTRLRPPICWPLSPAAG